MHLFRRATSSRGTTFDFASPPSHTNVNKSKAPNSKPGPVSGFVVASKKNRVELATLCKLIPFLLLVGLSVCWVKDWYRVDALKRHFLSPPLPSLRAESKALIPQMESTRRLAHSSQKGGGIALARASASQVGSDPPQTAAAAAVVVVVVGGGLAGAAAALEAARAGASVVLLEKASQLGGNSAKATSGINGWGTPAQTHQGVLDDGKYFERDTYRSGRSGDCRPELVRMLSVQSARAVEWLGELGVQLSVLSQLGGHSRQRTHRAPDRADGTPTPIGFAIMQRLVAHLRDEQPPSPSETEKKEKGSDKADGGSKRGSVRVLTNARLTRLLHESVTLPTGETTVVVRGVEYETSGEGGATTVRLDARAVVLATGGFSNDHTTHSLLQQYTPQLMGFPTTNGAWATGDGVKIARELGATLVDMDKVQLHPTGMINPKDPQAKTLFLGPEALRGSGGILLNKKGERFVNELGLRSVVSQAIITQDNEYPNSQGRKFAYCVLNEAAAQLFGKGALGFYWKKVGLFHFAENVHELAGLIGCEESTLLQTLQAYEALSSSGRACSLTGKDVFPCVLGPQGPFYVTHVTPSIHYTMGGCLISPSAEILTAGQGGLLGQHRPILGLFGAGEVTGGVHGGNRLAGNSLLECVVFGRIAGERAARTALEGPDDTDTDTDADASLRGRPALHPTRWTPGWVQQFGSEPAPSGGGGQLVLSLPSAFQAGGLELLQPLLLRPGALSVREGPPQRVVPTTLPEELGGLTVALPPPTAGASAWLYALRPGDVVELRAAPIDPAARAFKERLAQVEKGSGTELVVLAVAPEGVNPMLQLLRASLQQPWREKLANVRLLYGAKNLTELRYRDMLKDLCSERVKCLFALDNPPPKWIEEVDMDESTVKKILPINVDPSRIIAVVLARQDERASLLKPFFKTKQFEEGANLFFIPQ